MSEFGSVGGQSNFTQSTAYAAAVQRAREVKLLSFSFHNFHRSFFLWNQAGTQADFPPFCYQIFSSIIFLLWKHFFPVWLNFYKIGILMPIQNLGFGFIFPLLQHAETWLHITAIEWITNRFIWMQLIFLWISYL